MMPSIQGRRILPVFFVILSFFHALSAKSASAPPKIRVLLDSGVSALEVSGWDLSLSAESSKGLGDAGMSLSGRRSVRLQCRNGRVVARSMGREFSATRVRMTSPVGSLFWSSRLIREELSVQPGKQGCLVVNALDLEKYLDGVVNGEFSARWNAEAVSAQVIAARTYALYQMREARAKRALYDVDSTTRDQVYLGTAGEEARASQLVQKTRGWVLVAGAGASVAPIKAFYHSTCGGITESPESVWGKSQPGVSGAVLCQFCGTSPRLVWELSMSRAQVDEALMPLGLGPVSVIEVALRFPSGRARRVRLGFEKERGKRVFKDLPASQLRMLLGPERFQSTAFEVERTASSDWIFRGRGYGHGVGMCQWGAKEMGAAGYSAREILSRYYPQARLERAW